MPNTNVASETSFVLFLRRWNALGRQVPTYFTRSILCMAWRRKEPRHQHQLHWPSLSSFIIRWIKAWARDPILADDLAFIGTRPSAGTVMNTQLGMIFLEKFPCECFQWSGDIIQNGRLVISLGIFRMKSSQIKLVKRSVKIHKIVSPLTTTARTIHADKVKSI